MIELPECPRCHQPVDGARTPRGGAPGKGAFPDRSTGYCPHCHLGLMKVGGAWVATPMVFPA